MTIAVIDDSKADLQMISDCIYRYFTKQNAVPHPKITCFSSGEAFLLAFTAGAYDLILLDCCMKGLNGIETASEIRKTDKQAILVFITNSADYAVDGYLVAASGYLTKPFTDENFAKTMRVALRGGAERFAYLTLPTTPYQTKVPLSEIIYFDTAGHYIQVHRQGAAVLRVRMTFAALRELLAPHPAFLETYRGCILNMAHVQQVEALNFLMDSGARVPFRVKEHKKLLQQYSEYLFQKVRTVS